MPLHHSPVRNSPKVATLTPSADAASRQIQTETPTPDLSRDNEKEALSKEDEGDSVSVEEITVRENKKGESESQLDTERHFNKGMDRSAGDKTVGKLDESIFRKWENDSVSISRSSSDTSSGNESNICKGGPTKACGEEVQVGEAGVLCDRCHNWYHTVCQGISKLALKALEKHKVLAWLCTSCKADLKRGKPHRPSLSSLTSKVESLDETLRSHMAEVQQCLKEQEAVIKNQFAELKSHEDKTIQKVDISLRENELHKTYADMVKGTCAEVVKKVSDQISALPKPVVPAGNKGAQDLTGALDDFMDKEKRKSNVVVHNLPELEGKPQTERTEHDSSLFKTMIKEEMRLNVSVQKSFRVGKKIEGRDRLLIVTLDNAFSKHDILKLAPQLRHSKKFVRVYITPDLTRKERELSKKLRDELNSRKRAGETNLTIRGGRIVSLPPAPGPDRRGSSVTVPAMTASVNADHEAGVGQTEGLAVAPPGAGSDHSSQHAQVVPGDKNQNVNAHAQADVTKVGGLAATLPRAVRDLPPQAQTPQRTDEVLDDNNHQAEASKVGGLAVAPGAVSDHPTQPAKSANVSQKGNYLQDKAADVGVGGLAVAPSGAVSDHPAQPTNAGQGPSSRKSAVNRGD